MSSLILLCGIGGYLRLAIFVEDYALGQWGLGVGILRFFAGFWRRLVEGVRLRVELRIQLLRWNLGHYFREYDLES